MAHEQNNSILSTSPTQSSLLCSPLIIGSQLNEHWLDLCLQKVLPILGSGARIATTFYLGESRKETGLAQGWLLRILGLMTLGRSIGLSGHVSPGMALCSLPPFHRGSRTIASLESL